jgi:TonB family protein
MKPAILVVILLAGSAAALATAAPETTPPVPLWTPALSMPAQAAGMGVAPEVSVRVRIDEAGRPGNLEILAIEPPSDFDRHFERVTREEIGRWRYKPAQRDGQPVAATISWTIQFEDAGDFGDRARHSGWLRALTRPSRAGRSHRERVLAMPTADRLRLLDEQVATLKRFLDPEHTRRAESRRFVVLTDAPDPAVAETLASNLEATFGALHGALGLTEQPEEYKLVAVVYWRKAPFDQVKHEIEAIEWAAGLYSPTGLLLFHMEMRTGGDLLGIMLHEATHAYVDRYLARPGVVAPRWLDEGFAEYIGNSAIKRGRIVPGKVRHMEIVRSRLGVSRQRTGASVDVATIKRLYRKDEGPPLVELLRTDADTFYSDERREVFYAASWMLVHFLRHGEEGWAEEQFPALLTYIGEGYPGEEAFRAVYGEPAAFEERFCDYVRRF